MLYRHIIFFAFLISTFSFFGQSTKSPNISSFHIQAPQLQTEKQILVYLPTDYNTSNKSYQVIYMHDAQNLFDTETSFVGEWNVDEYLDSIGTNEAIVIGIEHDNEKRKDELTPFPNQKHGGGKADDYLQFIIKDLKPRVDSTYRTLKNPENTIIFGSSLGGLVSFYAVIKHPDVFGKAGVFSPSFWFNDQIYNYVMDSEIKPNFKFYFMSGDKESDFMVSDMEKMIALLLEKGVSTNHIKKRIIKDGRHNEKLWRENFPDAYQWLIRKSDN